MVDLFFKTESIITALILCNKVPKIKDIKVKDNVTNDDKKAKSKRKL